MKTLKTITLALLVTGIISCQNSENDNGIPYGTSSDFTQMTFVNKGPVGFTSITTRKTVTITSHGEFSYKEEVMSDTSETAEILSTPTSWVVTLTDDEWPDLYDLILNSNLGNSSYPDITIPEDSDEGSCAENGYTFQYRFLDIDVFEENEVEVDGSVVCHTNLIPDEINNLLDEINSLIEKYSDGLSTI